MPTLTRRPDRISIKHQMLFIASVPVFVATSFMILMSYQNNVRNNREQLERQGQLLAAQLAGALEYVLVADARSQIPATVSATMLDVRPSAVKIIPKSEVAQIITPKP